MGLNKFSDLTEREFRKMMTPPIPIDEDILDNNNTFTYDRQAYLPSYVSWTRQGKVTSVKDQGACNDCWAFAATGAVESMHAINTGRLYDLSEQQLVECVPRQDDVSKDTD